MMGTKDRMPKGARYPLFLIGLAVILLGSIEANSVGAAPATIGAIVLIGFAFLILSVAIR